MQPTDVCVVSKDGPESLPLIVRPKDGNSSVEFIKRWVSDNKDWIDEKLLEHGDVQYTRSTYVISCSIACMLSLSYITCMHTSRDIY